MDPDIVNFFGEGLSHDKWMLRDLYGNQKSSRRVKEMSQQL